MNKWYILKDKIPVQVSMFESCEWLDLGNRKIEETEIKGVVVSTVFLGFDHSFFEDEPVLFETMIFNGKHDDYQERYTSYDDAIKGHWNACDIVIKSTSKLFKLNK